MSAGGQGADARHGRERPAVTRSQLATELRAFGVRPGAITMVHTRMSAIGWVVGSTGTVVQALLDTLGPGGTLVAYASWEEHVYRDADRPEAYRDAYRAEPPVYDVSTAEAARENGRIPERVRTWPGAERSGHPEACVVGVGSRARWLTEHHPANDAYGARSPFARLVEADGQVLLLGAPLETTTLLHHAEAIARAPGKRHLAFRVAMAQADGGVVEQTYTDIDTAAGAFRYEALGLEDDPFEVIARAALASGIGSHGRVGQAESHLFPAPELTAFGVAWLEERFGRG